jgi:aspartate aminotransferase
MRNAFMRRRNMMLQLANDIKGIKVAKPQGAFYLFPDVSAFFGKKDGDLVIESADQLSIYLLEKGHVASVSGSAFGSPKNLRISYAASDEKLMEAMRRIKIALENLK